MTMKVKVYNKENGMFVDTINLSKLGNVVSKMLGHPATIEQVIENYFDQPNYYEIGKTSKDYILKSVPL
jgi:hypothetical protein